MTINRTKTTLPEDLVCLSHLRWGFVYQRPQHLLSRFAKQQRVFFVEESVETSGAPRLQITKCPESGVNICVPQMPEGLSRASQETIMKLLLNNLIIEQRITDYLLWYYTPMAISFSSHLKPRLTVFDCMDELSAFKDAPQEMKDREAELMRRADLVLTGGQSLYEAKLGRHNDLHVFPSSIEFGHFAQARTPTGEPADQTNIAHPRIGYCGVIDERMDVDLLEKMARLRPEYQFIMIGPIVKIDSASLPRYSNIHYLGPKSYKELPQYLAGWDAAMLPFAHNESTRFISPTKTPEYLAAGKPVVSTSITDVVRPYGINKLVRIADTAEEFVDAIKLALIQDANDADWKSRVDATLAQNSWDLTQRKIQNLIESRILNKELEIAGPSITAVRSQISPAALGD
jgi:UDP-galactopyranose mutase